MNWKKINELPTPAYLIDERQLKANGEVLKALQEKTSCKVLLAQKAFSAYDVYHVLEPYIAGTEASGLYEARLGAEEMPHKECHVFCGAYKEEEFEELLTYADHIVFNTPYQLHKFGAQAKAAGKEVGLRINPECSTQSHGIYDPCSEGSRLGTTLAQWQEHMTQADIALLDGLHFHTLCEQGSEDFAKTLAAVEEKFGKYLANLKWLNCGGGHYITNQGYNLPLLEELLISIHEKYGVQMYLEPGEAVVLNAGYLLTRVLDLTKNGAYNLCIVDCSGACHMPDVIEMPYTPPLVSAKKPGELPYTYRLGGQTCLAGDVIGEYSFDHQLQRGERLAFADMALYTMVKNNTFNGMPLPSIYTLQVDGTIKLIKKFGYDDFKYKLGSKLSVKP